MKQSLIVSPSILSYPLDEIGLALKDVQYSGSPWIHLDIMDGNFVPEISYGTNILNTVQRVCPSLTTDVHLMVNNPESQIDVFLKHKPHYLTFHYEASQDHKYLLQYIQKNKVKAGLVINPLTPISKVESLLGDLDLFLMMSVQAGYGGQKFIPDSLERIRNLASLREKRNLKFLISVDGGVNAQNICSIKNSGANVAVMGSFFRNTENKKELLEKIKSLDSEENL